MQPIYKLMIVVAGVLALTACKKSNDNAGQGGGQQAMPVAAIKVTPQDIPLSFESLAQPHGLLY